MGSTRKNRQLEQCGTCHFAPLFGGLLPLRYDLSEFEVLGVTQDAYLARPWADGDSGRFAVFTVRFYRGAFKTPVVRNAVATAPYMHNGALASLESVLQLYNEGGGQGLDVPVQTLPATPLQLTVAELQNSIDLVGALTGTS